MTCSSSPIEESYPAHVRTALLISSACASFLDQLRTFHSIPLDCTSSMLVGSKTFGNKCIETRLYYFRHLTLHTHLHCNAFTKLSKIIPVQFCNAYSSLIFIRPSNSSSSLIPDQPSDLARVPAT
ncbi:hypothetical protein CW304_30055 [Bacillus sp. UFRGS-B20]|nr:hypothetical protein CW304_30055 [Bacillus sp. UFRGS-B20]